MIVLENNGVRKTCPEGFSWTSLFFGVFVPALRGDLKTFVIQVVLYLVIGWTIIGALFVWLYSAFTYNKTYLEGLVTNGWTVIKSDEKTTP